MSPLRTLRIFILIISLLNLTYAYSQNLLRFESSEHAQLGNNVKLKFSKVDKGQKNYTLRLPNGLFLTYGEITAFGDFYEIYNKQVSLGKTNEEREQRFLAAFHSFAHDTGAVKEAKEILAIIHEEEKLVAEAAAKGEDPEKVYMLIDGEMNRRLNCVTGGGCDKSTWFLIPGRYLRLAGVDFDHFGKNALITYEVGHQLALKEAIAAHKTRNRYRLEIAYAMNAFASHFLSDRFAAGHIRTPRYELYHLITPHVTGSLLAGFMHREENLHGLHVTNRRGDHWIAYGDKAFQSNKNRTNRLILQEAMQKSADEIFSAYNEGKVFSQDTVWDLIPYAEEEPNTANLDISPLFYYDENLKKLLRRVNTVDVYDRNWTTNWWGWSTFVQLSKERGLPTESPGMLTEAGLEEAALQSGLFLKTDFLQQIDP